MAGQRITADIGWSAARRSATDAAAALPPVAVPLAAAAGAVLARPLVAPGPRPAFDTAAMDGYAVAGSAPWTVVGRLLAGAPGGPAVRPGTAVEIATGAPVPPGARAVVPYERATRAGTTVDGEPGAHDHIRRTGEECPAGAELVPAGRIVTPTMLGLAAAHGYDELYVSTVPRVGILVTGDEVVGAGSPGPGRVRDAIGPILPGVITWAGGRPEPVRHVPDGAAPLAAALDRCADLDAIVVCGASSHGPADHLRGVLQRLGAEPLVDGVACRPGHPQLLARLPGGPFVVGAPGHPNAALAAALTLLAPMLRGLAGRRVVPPECAPLLGEAHPHPTDTRLIAVRRDGAAVTPVGHDRAASLRGAALADALAVLPPAWCGDPVELLALPG